MTQSNGPALVILAAGMGSRYGGYKQLDSVGAEDESIMELSIGDAIKAGFRKVVLVINAQIAKQVEEQIILKYQQRVEIKTVFQELKDLPSGFDLPPQRKKPWGTAHAILSARKEISTPFVVINADDYYGRSSFGQIKEELVSLSQDQYRFVMLGYRLENTLSSHGGVSRGLCRIDNNKLLSIKEIINIRKTNGRIVGDQNGQEVVLSSQDIVSMNFWGFTPRIFSLLEEQFRVFLRSRIADPQAEFFITNALDEAIASGLSKVKVLTTAERWYGVTFREDRDEVRRGIQEYLADKR